MIEGIVNDYLEATVSLSAEGPRGQQRSIDAVIDTGFSGELSLPPWLVVDLGLTYESQVQAILANGATETLSLYRARLIWDNRAIDVLAAESDAPPLVGMSLLKDHELRIEASPGGRVRISTLAP